MAPAHMELALRVGVSPFCIALYCLIFFYRFCVSSILNYGSVIIGHGGR